MATVVVRNLPDETLRALKLRAAKCGRSTQAEIRAILIAAVTQPVKLGSALAKIGQQLGGVDIELPARRGVVRPVRL